MKKLNMLKWIAVAGVVCATSGAAFAACTVPSGKYVGAGGGSYLAGAGATNPGSVSNGGVINGSYSVNFVYNSTTKILSGTYYARSKNTGNNITTTSVYSALVTIPSGTIPNASVATTDPTSLSTVNYFNTTTCTGIITMTGAAMVTATAYDSLTPTTLPTFSAGWTEKGLWVITVSNSGAVITLTNYNNQNANGGSIRLERP